MLAVFLLFSEIVSFSCKPDFLGDLEPSFFFLFLISHNNSVLAAIVRANLDGSVGWTENIVTMFF